MIDFWQQTAAELQLPPATVACVVRAAAQYDLPPGLVLSVMKVEGGVDGAVHRNSNGSYDYGLMQINSVWLPKLASMGFTREHLVHQACDNVSVASWILRQNLDASDHFWKGVGNYHSRNVRANQDYQRKIAAAARKLPEGWQWWNPNGWNLKTLAARLPWNRDGSPALPEVMEASATPDAASGATLVKAGFTGVIKIGAYTPIPARAITAQITVPVGAGASHTPLQGLAFTPSPSMPSGRAGASRLASAQPGAWSGAARWGKGATMTLGSLDTLAAR